MSSQKAKEKEIIATVDDDNELSGDESGGSEPEQPTNEPGAQTSSSKKKKKKKKTKLAKILNPSAAAEDKLVETVLEKVKAEHADADEATVRAALQQLNLKDVVSGKSGLGGKNQKDTGGHKVRDYRVLYVECTNSGPAVLGYPARPTIWYCLSSSPRSRPFYIALD